MLKKTVLRRQYLSKFDTLCNQTTYKKGQQKKRGTASRFVDNNAVSRQFIAGRE